MTLGDFVGMYRRVVATKRARDHLVAFALLVGSIGVLAAGGVSGKPNSGPVTTKNWMTHPSIKQIRETVADVVDGMKSGKIKAEEIVYDITSDECGDHIVTVYEIIGVDGYGTVRFYKEVQFMAPEVVGFTEYFLDRKGTTRFLYVSYDEEGWQNSRAYFDESGNGLFSIEQIGGKYLEDRMNAGEYLRFTSEKIKETYEIKAECPVKSQKILPKEQVTQLLSDKRSIKSVK